MNPSDRVKWSNPLWRLCLGLEPSSDAPLMRPTVVVPHGPPP